MKRRWRESKNEETIPCEQNDMLNLEGCILTIYVADSRALPDTLGAITGDLERRNLWDFEWPRNRLVDRSFTKTRYIIFTPWTNLTASTEFPMCEEPKVSSHLPNFTCNVRFWTVSVYRLFLRLLFSIFTEDGTTFRVTCNLSCNCLSFFPNKPESPQFIFYIFFINILYSSDLSEINALLDH